MIQSSAHLRLESINNFWNFAREKNRPQLHQGERTTGHPFLPVGRPVEVISSRLAEWLALSTLYLLREGGIVVVRDHANKPKQMLPSRRAEQTKFPQNPTISLRQLFLTSIFSAVTSSPTIPSRHRQSGTSTGSPHKPRGLALSLGIGLFHPRKCKLGISDKLLREIGLTEPSPDRCAYP